MFNCVDAIALQNENLSKTAQDDLFIIHGQNPGFWVGQFYPLQRRGLDDVPVRLERLLRLVRGVDQDSRQS